MTRAEYLREWRKNNPERQRVNRERWRAANPERTREINRNTDRRLRESVIDGYGGACRCCGETTYAFLTIDHVDGGGSVERRDFPGQGKFLRRLRDEGFPDRYRLLCWNCNSGRAVNGGICPHEEART